jgi:hypothetical protein
LRICGSMKTPGTNAVSGEPDVKAFVSGNKFDMSEAGVHITYGGAKYVLDHFVLKTPRCFFSSSQQGFGSRI